MAKRYGIVTADRTLGVPMAQIQKIAKTLGRDHALAAAVWRTRVYEGRMLAIYVAEPERLTATQMEAWARDFDNWGIVDTACFKLFDQSPHAWAMARAWVKREEEFVKRAGFALIACLALHTKSGPDAPFLAALKLIEREAKDERNFVKKGVSWAVRAIGQKKSPALKAAAVAVAARLAASENTGARWAGKDALRALRR
ncbi:MAG: DNA alkylation repair protein [Alphaproteobacteria bacterium]|nr:DNA alkylation repair protein [Alphaproteobacteria bacterium]